MRTNNNELNKVLLAQDVSSKGWVLESLGDLNTFLPKAFIYASTQHKAIFTGCLDLANLMSNSIDIGNSSSLKDDYINICMAHTNRITNNTKYEAFSGLTNKVLSDNFAISLLGYFNHTKAAALTFDRLLQRLQPISIFIVCYTHTNGNVTLRPFVTGHDSILSPLEVKTIVDKVVKADLERNPNYYR
jgi:hypothetical protein